MSEEKRQLTERQGKAVTVLSIFLMVGSYITFRAYDPLQLFNESDLNRIFSPLDIIYILIGVGIGYIPIGILSIYKRSLI